MALLIGSLHGSGRLFVMNTAVLWDLTPCSLAAMYGRLKESAASISRMDTSILRNVGIRLQRCTSDCNLNHLQCNTSLIKESLGLSSADCCVQMDAAGSTATVLTSHRYVLSSLLISRDKQTAITHVSLHGADTSTEPLKTRTSLHQITARGVRL
jgi:hypothetical protein